MKNSEDKLIKLIILFIVGSACLFTAYRLIFPKTTNNQQIVSEEVNQEQPPVTPNPPVEPETPSPEVSGEKPDVKPEPSKPAPTKDMDPNKIQPTYINGILLVNKDYGLPPTFGNGDDPTALAKLQQLQRDAQAQGINISNSYSGYRSYQYQTKLYNNYVNQQGEEEANTFSAKPGFSEHQTGLTFDLKDFNGQLVEDPITSQWIKDNCAKYGFIVRYPEGKEDITGYIYEPWHLRYVGEEVANQIMNNNTTLEQYLGVK